MKIIAHRGIHDEYKENTYDSIKEGFESNYTSGVEFDVRLTKDKEVVVIHDETIDRTSDGTGFVNKMTLKQLKKFNFGTVENPKQIPLLKEVLEINTNKIFLIEIKPQNIEVCYYVNEIIKNTNKCIMVQSFDRNIILKMIEINPQLKLGMLINELNIQDLDLALDFTTIKYDVLDDRKINNLIFVYTVNNDKQFKYIKSKKVNIITNNPKYIYDKTH